MTETLLEKLSSKITEVYDVELAKEITDIFIDLTEQIKEDSYRYFNLVKKLAKREIEKERQERVAESYKKAFEVAKETYNEEREHREKMEREKEQAEYDKEYFVNFAKELLENR